MFFPEVGSVTVELHAEYWAVSVTNLKIACVKLGEWMQVNGKLWGEFSLVEMLLSAQGFTWDWILSRTSLSQINLSVRKSPYSIQTPLGPFYLNVREEQW